LDFWFENIPSGNNLVQNRFCSSFFTVRAYIRVKGKNFTFFGPFFRYAFEAAIACQSSSSVLQLLPNLELWLEN
jgi:hypothetical protein